MNVLVILLPSVQVSVVQGTVGSERAVVDQQEQSSRVLVSTSARPKTTSVLYETIVVM